MKFNAIKAGPLIMAAVLTAAVAIDATGVAAQDHTPIAAVAPAPTQFVATPVVQPLTGSAGAPAETAPEAPPAISLAAMVDTQPQPEALTPELRCLAAAIYFEARGQSLAGQLAVGRVIVNRAASGRFPSSYCGVVYQHAQFGFVRGESIPAIARGSRSWREAVAVAQIADANGWKCQTEGALYFHATRVSPGWNRVRIARIDDHVFYR